MVNYSDRQVITYGAFGITALCALHVAFKFDSHFFGIILLCISLFCVFEAFRDSSSNSVWIAPLVAAACIALRYFYVVITGDMSNQYLIATSDSLLYHNVAVIIAVNFPLSDQFFSIEHVQMAGDQLGYLIPNRGMYWFLGILYTVVGFESGPSTFFIINIFATMAIAYHAVRIAELIGQDTVHPVAAILFSFIIFSMTPVADHALHLRKDYILVAFFISSIYYSLAGNYIIALVFSLFVLQLRSIFFPVLIVFLLLQFFVFKRKNIVWHYIVGANKLIFMCFAGLVVLVSSNVGGFVSGLALASADGDVNTLELLSNDLGGSAVFAYNSLLQWLYVVVYPFPPLSPFAYSNIVAFDALFVFLMNIFLFASALLFARRNSTSGINLQIVFLLLYILLLLNLVTGATAGFIGVVEARYKFAIWVIGGIMFLCNSMKRE